MAWLYKMLLASQVYGIGIIRYWTQQTNRRPWVLPLNLKDEKQNYSGRTASWFVNLVSENVIRTGVGELLFYCFLPASSLGSWAAEVGYIKIPDDICVQGNSNAVLHLVKLDLKDWVIEVLPDSYGYSDFHQSLWEWRSPFWPTEQSCWENSAPPPKRSNSLLPREAIV